MSEVRFSEKQSDDTKKCANTAEKLASFQLVCNVLSCSSSILSATRTMVESVDDSRRHSFLTRHGAAMQHIVHKSE